MEASDRVSRCFDAVSKPGHAKICKQSFAEQVVFFVVVARCEKDMNGFSSIFEQALDGDGMKTLIQGLDAMSEPELAGIFRQIFEAIQADGFYEGLNWKCVSNSSKTLIDLAEDKIGERLWELDEKMATLLDSSSVKK
jgi:hypothetical protein